MNASTPTLESEVDRFVELVVVAHDQVRTLEESVRRLHAHLTAHGRALFPCGWAVTVVDHASTDATGAIADRLATELDHVSALHLTERVDRKALRAHWIASPASIAAFLTLTPDTDLDALLAPLVTHVSPAVLVPRRGLTRRGALVAVGGAGLVALLAACGRNGSSSAPATNATNTTKTGTASATGVVLAPEMTEGPYYLDLDLVRSDIREDREGAPMSLTLSVIDVDTGSPVSGAAVDIWHCDADGLYSGFVSQSAGANRGASDLTDDGTFLRGTQMSDGAGNVTFTTIYPGWYQGRTVHIHVKAHVNGQEIHTGQLFFDDEFTDGVFTSTDPYSSRGDRTTRNANDNIYAGGGDKSTLTVTKDGDTYATRLAMGVSA